MFKCCQKSVHVKPKQFIITKHVFKPIHKLSKTGEYSDRFKGSLTPGANQVIDITYKK